jgi:predicted RNase H-like nuclease (RuvC/YqgF family)
MSWDARGVSPDRHASYRQRFWNQRRLQHYHGRKHMRQATAAAIRTYEQYGTSDARLMVPTDID